MRLEFRAKEGGFYTPDFVFDNYARFLSLFFGKVLGFSLFLAICVAVCCVVLGIPFTYLLTKMTRNVPCARRSPLWLPSRRTAAFIYRVVRCPLKCALGSTPGWS